MSIASDVQTLAPGEIIDLFELDSTAIAGGSVVRWCNYVNEKGTDVVWGGDTYTRLPIEAEGFSRSGDSKQPRPKVRVSNIGGIVGSLANDLEQLAGAKLTRHRTFVKYLDATNFVSGNASADPNAAFADEVWYVDRKASENPVFIEFELASALDLTGVKLPRRVVNRNTCPWAYRGAECGYTGDPVADINDQPTTDSDEDVCGKRVNSCQLRFGIDSELPFGAFPGVGRN